VDRTYFASEYYLRTGDDWSLVYYFSDERLWFIAIKENRYDGFATNCACTDVQGIKEKFLRWDDPMVWAEAND
jgi:hypothetical protein